MSQQSVCISARKERCLAPESDSMQNLELEVEAKGKKSRWHLPPGTISALYHVLEL